MCCQSDIHHRHCTAVSSAGLLPPSPVCHWKKQIRPAQALSSSSSARSTGAKSKSSPQWVRMSATVSLICARHSAASKGRCASSANSFTSSPAPVYPSSEAGGPPYPWYPPRNATTSLRRCLAQYQRPRLGGA